LPVSISIFAETMPSNPVTVSRARTPSRVSVVNGMPAFLAAVFRAPVLRRAGVLLI
jgi:NADPH-dependent glutamate synthase beta subunit-like oxidoreductase